MILLKKYILAFLMIPLLHGSEQRKKEREGMLERYHLVQLIYAKNNASLDKFFKENPGSTEWDLRNGQTAGHLLLNTNNIPGIHTWLDNGASCSQTTTHHDKFPGSTILHALCFKRLRNNIFTSLFQKISSRNPSLLNLANHQGVTPAYMLAAKSSFSALELLYQQGGGLTQEEQLNILKNNTYDHSIPDQKSAQALQFLLDVYPKINSPEMPELIIALAKQQPFRPQTFNAALSLITNTNKSVASEIAYSIDQNPAISQDAKAFFINKQNLYFSSANTSQAMTTQAATNEDATCYCCKNGCYCCSSEISGPHTQYWYPSPPAYEYPPAYNFPHNFATDLVEDTDHKTS